ncbi:cytidine deaminase-like protein [Diplogelasinospora grovesii]|uniref:cytidine deaminase n=1 Tax=Diplogelasinospora grovesii TaxID=303347 RepID=A0AAN6NDB7_9PEZI|nr:cytidine deaminase-like protein [Diplogelasinospora grovesii]
MDTTEDFSPYRADGKLYGFVCVVTGASQAIGQAIVHELAAHGAASIYGMQACDKAASAETETTSRTLHDNIGAPNPAGGTNVIPYPFDVTREDETLVLIDEVLNAYGRLDAWVCCSSSSSNNPPSPRGLLHEATGDDVQRCLEAHALAPLWALKHAPAAMAKLTTKAGAYPNAAPKSQEYGSIIVINESVTTANVLHTMAAHAALGVVRSGVAVLKGSGSKVRINCISPGQINTSGIEEAGSVGTERAGNPQEVARVAGFLASGFSSYMTGANLVVDGGASIAPPAVLSSQDPEVVSQACRAYGLGVPEFHELRTRARAAKSTSYSPYSRFRVGAVVLAAGASGAYISGANVENASYPVSTCAERVALTKAVTEGHYNQHHQQHHHHQGFKAIAVATDITPPASPCGMCRQCIREFCAPSTPIVMFDKNDNFSIMRLDELLPLSFGPEALGVAGPATATATAAPPAI